MVLVYLLGGFSLGWDQANRQMIQSQTARSLFAYLVTFQHHPHTRNLLIGTFWPDLPEPTARRRLSKALWQIRRVFSQPEWALKDPFIITQGDTVQINSDIPLWVDVTEFIAGSERCLHSAENLLEPCQLCVDLYQGEFLAGYHDDWILLERERLREVFLDVLAELVVGHKLRGNFNRALRFARRLALEDPWREAAHREVMRLCHLLGQDAEAMNQFDACRQILAEELDAEPSTETQLLAAEIGARSIPTEIPVLPSRARPFLTPFLERPDQLPLIGRHKELAELLHQLELVIEGNGRLIIIEGEAGVGKSHLLRELAQNAAWRGLAVLWGHCHEFANSLAYLPLAEALRASIPALLATKLKPLWRSELSRILPELTETDDLAPALSAEEEKFRLLEAISQAFLALAEISPQVVLLEDAHWLDPASLELLSYLLPRLATAKLLFVISVRPEELTSQEHEQLPTASLAQCQS